ncbi:MAG: 23S rRNA (pseudouridine(1915)-N(3))-methyltransferase RlmH [Alphaproteobacteria bacterium]|nr:23S rRNA (pseudouridine(1915)-N(3))-methyltransferase RlmH [Alphaproteobacteria bacterium]
MRIHLIAVGRAKAGPEKTLFDHYTNRLSWPFTLKEVEEKKKLPPLKLKEREAELLLAAVPKGATIVALDERGREFKSLEFATKLEGWRDNGVGDIAFLIGGADGHGEAIRQKAALLVSLGKATWPHMLVRPMIVEQIYRGQCILSGHPYHRE